MEALGGFSVVLLIAVLFLVISGIKIINQYERHR